MNVPTPSRLARYLTVVLRWLAITLVVFVLSFLTGAFITDNLLAKVYTATAQMQIIPADATSLGSHDAGSEDTAKVQAQFFNAELSTMQSSDFLLPIIHDLDLDKAWDARVFKSKEDQLSDEDALAYMHKMLKLDFVRGTNVIAITASSDVPEEAAAIANAIADRYKAMRDVGEDQRNNLSGATLRNQLQESPVRIISRAEIPAQPDRSSAFLVTMIVAGVLSIMAASFVEIILLFSRAGERMGN